LPIINLTKLAERAYLGYVAIRYTIDGGVGGAVYTQWEDLPEEEKGLWEILVDVILRNYDEMKRDTKTAGRKK
jgi:hypothetical protein